MVAYGCLNILLCLKTTLLEMFFESWDKNYIDSFRMLKEAWEPQKLRTISPGITSYIQLIRYMFTCVPSTWLFPSVARFNSKKSDLLFNLHTFCNTFWLTLVSTFLYSSLVNWLQRVETIHKNLNFQTQLGYLLLRFLMSRATNKFHEFHNFFNFFETQNFTTFCSHGFVLSEIYCQS